MENSWQYLTSGSFSTEDDLLRDIIDVWNDYHLEPNPNGTDREVEIIEKNVSDCLSTKPPNVYKAAELTYEMQLLISSGCS